MDTPNPTRIQLRRGIKGWRMPANSVSVARPHRWGNPFDDMSEPAAVRVAKFRAMLAGELPSPKPEPYPSDFSSLHGKNLGCFCKLGEPCHADILLELANR
jgi:Domain of unknown function (DUF4326)